MKSYHSFFIFPFTFLIAGILFSCSTPSNNETIIIGSLLSLTGPGAALGEQIRIGQEISKDYWGQEGVQLHIDVVDNKSSPAEAVSAFQQLSARGHHIFVANMSNACMKIKELIDGDTQTLLAMASIPGITHPVKKGVFMYSQTAQEEVESLLSWLNTQTNFRDNLSRTPSRVLPRKLFVIYSEDDYGIGFVTYLEERAKTLNFSVTKVSYTQNDADKMRTIIHSAIPETFTPIVVGIGAPLIQSIGALRSLGYGGPILTNIGYAVSGAKEALGKDAGHVVFTLLETRAPLAEDFLITEYARRTGGKTLPAEAIAGFNSINIIVESINKSGSTKAEDINEHIVKVGRSISTSIYPGSDNEIVIGVRVHEDF